MLWHQVKKYKSDRKVTAFAKKEPFVKQNSSSDVKGSLWNHLDKKGSSMASWSTFIFKSLWETVIVMFVFAAMTNNI